MGEGSAENGLEMNASIGNSNVVTAFDLISAKITYRD